MTTLAAQQQALLDVLFALPKGSAQVRLRTLLVPDATVGLAAYAAHGHALADRALQAAYPVLAEFIGHENFTPLARDFWHAHPPRSGDLFHWGEALADWLALLPALADEPCLPDLARVEWALHQAASAPDVSADLPSFQRLIQEDTQGLGFLLAPGTALIRSRWPVVSLVQAHRERSPSLALAAQRLKDRVAECALVWRQGLRPRLSVCTPAEARWLEALIAGASLTDALDGVADPSFDLGNWLPHAVQQGQVLGAISIPLTHSESS